MQRAWTRLKSIIKPVWIWWLLIVLGVILRLRQYLLNRSFWADEASLAYNLVTRTFSGLTRPLDYQQGAPIGFLFIEKLSVIVFGNSEYTMRLFPLLSGILAIYLLYRIARTHFGTSALFALVMFSVGWELIYYSSELKQYSSDVMIALLLIYQASRCVGENARPKDFLLLGIGGVIAMWVSHPSAFVLAGIGLVLVLERLPRKEFFPPAWILAMGLVWVGSFALEYYVSLRHLAADEFMQSYWSKAFMPLPPWREPGWFLGTYYSLLLMSFSTHITAVLLIPTLAFIGALSLFSRNRSIALLVILPALIALIASALQKYPLKDRFMLFLVPFLLLLICEGLGRIHTLTARWNRNLALLLAALPAILLIWTPGTRLQDFFITSRGSDVRPVIQYVGTNRQPGDIVYVFHGSDPAFHYYAPRYGITTGTIIVGFDTPRKRVALQRFFDDVDALDGSDRVWFIFSDIYDCGDCEGDMQAFYVGYLDEFGRMLDQFNASGANAYLYDLNQ